MARTHEELDLRSLALHSRVAERLRVQPALLQIARDNLERWRSQGDEDDPAAAAIREWQEILDSLSIDELCKYLVRRDERATRLRQSSPFAGILAPAEVWEVKRRFNGEKAPA